VATITVAAAITPVIRDGAAMGDPPDAASIRFPVTRGHLVKVSARPLDVI
jgi:hypothetical protein